MSYTVCHHIDGQLVNIPEGSESPIFNPARGETIGSVILGRNQACEAAIFSALKAFESWSQTPPVKRAKVLYAFRSLLEKNQPELVKLVTQEHGKTFEDAQGSVARGIELVEWHCNILSHWQGNFTAEAAQGIDCHTLRQPLGVCVGISPFNFPVMVPLWMMIPAIACGNTFILKPSEQDPSAPLRLIQLLEEAGLPPGVVNCLQGDKHTVEYLLKHPHIQAVSAVASSAVAEQIYKTAITYNKRAHTFGGAKNHAVIMPDADMDYAAQAIVGAAYGSAGERCMAIAALVVVGEATADQLVPKLRQCISKIKIDAGDAAEVDMGPLISRAHQQKVLSAIDAGIAEGADLIVDGRAFKHPEYMQGFFIGPCLFDHVTEVMSVYQNELFGPVLVILRVDSLEEALGVVNRHQYGNGSAIFTRDGYSARKYSEKVQVGMVGINIPIPVPISSHPFGGWKRSFFGDTAMHGEESIRFYTRLKTITSKWPTSISSRAENMFTMPTHS